MGTFRVELGAESYPVRVGAGILDQVGEYAREGGLKPGRAAVITDANVNILYGFRVNAALKNAGFDPIPIEIPAGEGSKSLTMLATLYDRMTEAELGRQSPVFALGGGVPGDLGGFAAATYLRGLPLVQVPTTLVAQVDSSLGGKTGVNQKLAKNLIGAFYQPRLVVADVETLSTLPEREFCEGMAEVVKYGAIMDADFIGYLEANRERIMTRQADCLSLVVELSLRCKGQIVEADQRETSLRKILNFGHTVGHALEASSGYGNYLHGEAVAIGMAAATGLSRKYAGLSDREADRFLKLIEAMGLPIAMPVDWRVEDFSRALRLDKKRADGGIDFVLLDRLGHAITKNLTTNQILSEIF